MRTNKPIRNRQQPPTTVDVPKSSLTKASINLDDLTPSERRLFDLLLAQYDSRLRPSGQLSLKEWVVLNTIKDNSDDVSERLRLGRAQMQLQKVIDTASRPLPRFAVGSANRGLRPGQQADSAENAEAEAEWDAILHPQSVN